MRLFLLTLHKRLELMSKFITLIILFSILPFFHYSQIAVRKFDNKSFSFNNQDSVFNINTDCYNSAFGYFLSDTNTLEINQGLIISTGKICSIIGPNNENNESSVLNYTPQSSWFELNNKYDVCIVEFDYITLEDTLKFNIQFGSEEYPEYVNSDYSDFFGIFLSGNEFQSPKNIAKINNEAISINSINNSLNNNLYIDNTSNHLDIAFDGLTKKITFKENITSNLKYHVAFVINDVGDKTFDSGVFIETASKNFTPDSLDSIKCSNSNNYPEKTNPEPIKISYQYVYPHPVESSFNFIIDEYSIFEGITDTASLNENFILTYKVINELGNTVLSGEFSYNDLVFFDGQIFSKNQIDISNKRNGFYFLELQSKVKDGYYFNYSFISEKQFIKFLKI